MSILGALQAGVSGLSSQSSAMGAVADNIANMNTIGYKNNNVSFFCKFTKIYRGTIDNKAMKKIERFNNKQWKKYKNKMLGDDYYEANNQI